MNNGQDRGLVALSDIAELAGVSRAAVSKWRNQRESFPVPRAGTPTRPLFLRVEIEDWMRSNGYSTQVDKGAASLAVLAAINRFTEELPTNTMRLFVLTILCARKLADQTAELARLSHAATEGFLLEALREISWDKKSDRRWRDLVTRGLDLVGFPLTAEPLAGEIFTASDTENLADVSDLVLDRLGTTDGRPPGAYGAVGSRVAQLLAAGGANASGTIYDPACGIGEALLSLWKENSNRKNLHIVGDEVVEDFSLICRQRFFLHDAYADIENHDVLASDPRPNLHADIIIAEPPFSEKMPEGFSVTDPRWTLAGLPPRNNSETAWLQHVITHLAPDGRGFAITAVSTTAAAESAEIRSALIRQGCVQSVVALPRRFLTHTAVATALWILRPAHAPTSSAAISLIDASAIEPENFTGSIIAKWLSSEKIDSRDILRRDVRIGDLVADGRFNLDPRYWNHYPIDATEREKRRKRCISALQNELENLAVPRELAVKPPTPAETSMTLRALERQGLAKIAQSRVQTPHGGASETVEPLVTEPGDIVVVKRPAISVKVDARGGTTLDPGVTIVRLDKAKLTPEYAAECIGATWNRRKEGGTEIFAAAIRDLEIPIIPLRDQARLAEELSHIRRLASSALRIVAAADDLASAQLETIRFGSDIPQLD